LDARTAMIIIVPYDPGWPAMFVAEAASIQDSMAALALRIEHVGSTAVPGLAAKPVVDIQISVSSLERLSIYLEPLARVGYTHLPFGEVDRVYPFFRKPDQWPSTHHIHLCVLGSDHERRHLAFRDYLRDHPAIADEYVQLKRTLAAANQGATLESREAYSLSKTSFVSAVVQRALADGYPLHAKSMTVR
jgi:GrpB-like predicted nucleotidyltransferase (UPF0157 family)